MSTDGTSSFLFCLDVHRRIEFLYCNSSFLFSTFYDTNRNIVNIFQNFVRFNTIYIKCQCIRTSFFFFFSFVFVLPLVLKV